MKKAHFAIAFTSIVLLCAILIFPQKSCASHEEKILSPMKAEKLLENFNSYEYDLAKIRKNEAKVPAIITTKNPDDIKSIKSHKAQKELFFKMLLPIVLKQNKEILSQREKLVTLAKKEKVIPDKEKKWINKQADSYKIAKRIKVKEKAKALLKRMDVIPVSLCLAQGAVESAWGTSRFAKEGNAFFGEWTRNGPGIVPAKRPEGQTHKVKSFKTIEGSVKSYMKNLNTHKAYKKLRDKREQLRKENKNPDGYSLAETLTEYSALGYEYVEILHSIMNKYSLLAFDGAELETPRLIKKGE